MRQRPKTLGFAFLLTLLAALHVGRSADAASVSRRCRRACRDQIAACVAGGGRARACRKSLLERCQQEGVAVCQGQAGQFSAALAGDCSSPTVVPAQGGTFSGTTSGASALAGSCGNSDGSPEQVFRWTPTVSGTATIQTCGAGTTFDTVLYLRSGGCASGPEVAGCNDDACANASGLYRASRITPTVTAGQTYFIVVDGYAGATGTFSLTVTPPDSATTTTSPTTTTTTLPGSAACSSPAGIPAQGGTMSGATSGATSGASALAGSCGSSGDSPERVYQWTPTVSGTATIQTCGAGTSFDTVLYLRSGVCASGPEMAAGCNDDACADASGLVRASRITPTVTAGQTYFIVVDGYGGATGTFSLTVTPPSSSTTTTTRPPTTTTSTTTTTTTRPPTTTTTTTQPSSTIRTVFLIVMENTDWSSIKGSASAPYINRTLLPIAAHAEQYYNPPNMHPSLPNYLWLEAGTNFGILDDNDPSSNRQSTTSHLVNMLEAAGISWKTYQEDEGSGGFDGTYCPTGFDGNWYDVNHNPFAYFTDITNNTARCIQHVRPYSEFLTDLASNTVPRYNFIVPDLCHDMHENVSCSQSNRILFGDTWLSTEVPKILASQAYLNNGALFITWDEGASGDGPIGMIVLSPKAKGGGYSNTIAYDHSSTLRTMQEIFNVPTPMLRDAANATDLRDLFVSFP